MELNFCYGCMEPLEQGVTLCSRCGYDNSQPQNPDDLLPEGTILNGKYLIGKVLGRGGFGVTYLGLELNLLIKVAIKEYFPVGVGIRSPYSLKVKTASSLSNPEDFQTGLTEFLKEARTLASFNSPYFVHVREFFNENGTAYIVMDFVEGTGLDKEIGSCGKMPWERVLSLMKPLMLELDKMHKLGLIHRDIKPGNIRISKDKNTGEDRLILLDFGSARHFVSQNVTKTYTAMITSGFSPLEQYSERSRQGPYTDIYAVCATIYAALTGVVPPAATDRVSGEVDIQPFSSFGVNVPEKIEKAISHGLAVKGADRPRTMKELYDELTEDTPDSEPEHKKSDNVPEKKPTSGSKKLWIYGLILAALAIGLVFIFNGKTNNNTALHTAQTDGLIELTNDTEKQKATEASIKNTPSPGQIQSSDNNSRQSDEIHKSETAVMEQTRIAETNTQDAVLSAEQTRTAGTSTQQALLLEEEIKIAQTGTLEALFAEQTQIAGTSTQQAMFAEQTQIAGTSTQQAVFAVQTQIAGTSTQQTVFSEQTQIAGTSTQQAMFAEQTKIAGTSTQQAVFAEQTQIAGTSTQQAVFAEQTQIAGTSTQQAVFAEQTKNAEVKTQEAIRFEQTEIVREETITAMNAMQTQIAGTSTQQAVFAVQTQIAGTSTQQTVFSEQTQIAGTSTQQAMFAEQTKIAGTSTQQAVFAEQTQIAGTSTQQAVFAEQTQIAGTSTQQAVFAEQTKNAEVKTQEAIRFEQTEIAREETITAMNAMQTQIAGTQNAIHERETADVVNTQQSANYMAMTVVAEKQSTLEALNTKAAERTSTPLPPTNTPKPAATKTPVPTQKPTATPTRSKTRPSVGSYIVFGSYEQDNNRSNGKESIRWKVLSVEGNKALLLSSYILDAQQFHNSGEIGGGWASSKLRSWMMNDFYNAAFSSNEKKAILTIGQRATSKDTTDDYDTVFILSTDQVKKYLTKTSERQFMATTYAIRARKVFRGADGYYNWWTRSNHIESGSFWKDKIDIVRKYGEIAYTNPTDADCGILPAVWIDINQYMNL